MALAFAGCGSAQKDATESAVNAAQRAVSAAQDAAEKYAPEELKAAQDALQSAKDAIAKSNYQEALKDAEDAVQKAKASISAASTKKEDWSKGWKDLSVSAPRALNEAKDRLDAYTKKGKLPPGVSSDQMAEAQAEYEKLKQAWTNANAAYQRGDLADAMKNAKWVQEGLQKLKDLLGTKS
jgi:DNA repair exonuclease SbcCD ATPase subunit